MAKTMEQYMSKTRADYGSGVTRPKIMDKDHFELKGQFFKELRNNTFSGSNHEDANEYIEKVLEIVDLFHIPNITQDQVMLRAFPMSLTIAANRWTSLYGDYIELNDLNVPLELRRDQVDDLMPTIEEGEVIEEVKSRNDNKMVSDIFGYPSDYDHDEKIRIDCAYNLKELGDPYLDEGIGEVVVGEPFCKVSCMEARRFNGIITIHDFITWLGISIRDHSDRFHSDEDVVESCMSSVVMAILIQDGSERERHMYLPVVTGIDIAVYAFMVKNPNGSNVLHHDLEQIHEDDLKAMDLKWQLSLLSLRAKKYYQRTGKNIFINANDIARPPRSVQTNMALMAFSDLEVYTDKTCFKTYLKNYETLKKQCDDLIVKLNQTEFTAATYKIGLATVEEQLITYRKNEVLFSEEVAVLKREVACKDYEINMPKSEFEKVKQEKDGIEFKIKKFDKASKDLDQLLGSQITDKSKKGLGYNAVPPPHPLIYNRPKKLDLSYSGLDEFKEPKFNGYGPEKSEQESNVVGD
ncbi:hypothetical protein Tco_0033971 [Tanacetum coccineum]